APLLHGRDGRLRDVAKIRQCLLRERARHRDQQRSEEETRQKPGQETRSHGAMINREPESSYMKLTHFNAGGEAHMVDVGAKQATHRIARAAGRIRMRPATLRTIAAGRAGKGDVLGTARIAAIQAAKRTPELIPLAHPLALTRVGISFALDRKVSAV